MKKSTDSNTPATNSAAPTGHNDASSETAPAARKNTSVGRFFLEVLFSEGGLSLLVILPAVVIYYLMRSL